MAIALDQMVVFAGNDGGVGDNPTNFTTTAAVASGAYVFCWLNTDVIPSSVTVGGTASIKAREQTLSGEFISMWYAYKISGMASSSTIAVSFGTAPAFISLLSSSFTGIRDTSPLDQANSRTQDIPLNWGASAITPTSAPSIVFGYMLSTGGMPDSRSTPDNSFIELHDVFEFGNNVVQYKIVSDTATIEPTGTFAVTQPPGRIQPALAANFLPPASATSASITVARHGAGMGRW